MSRAVKWIEKLKCGAAGFEGYFPNAQTVMKTRKSRGQRATFKVAAVRPQQPRPLRSGLVYTVLTRSERQRHGNKIKQKKLFSV